MEFTTAQTAPNIWCQGIPKIAQSGHTAAIPNSAKTDCFCLQQQIFNFPKLIQPITRSPNDWIFQLLL